MVPTRTGSKCGTGGDEREFAQLVVDEQRVNLPTGLSAGFAQGGHETLPVFFIQEDGFTPIPAIHHLVNRTFVFNA